MNLDTMTKIKLMEIGSQYLARIELLYTVSDLIEAEQECRFVDFFDLASSAILQVVALYLTSLCALTSRQTTPPSSPKRLSYSALLSSC